MRTIKAKIVPLALAALIILSDGACPGDRFLDGSRIARRIVALEDGTVAILGSAAGSSGYHHASFSLATDQGTIIADNILMPYQVITPTSASLTSTGDILLGGRLAVGSPFAIIKTCVMRVSPNGKVVWFEALPGPPGYEGYGIGDTVDAILELPDRRIAIVGDAPSYPFHAMLTQWGQLIESTSIGDFLYSTSCITKSNHLVICGVSYAEDSSGDIRVQNLSEDRSLGWDLTFTHVGAERAHRAVEAKNSDVVIIGTVSHADDDFASRRLYLLRIGGDGESLWEREYDVPFVSDIRYWDNGPALAEAEDGSLFATASNVVLKLDPDGEEQWRVSVTGTIFDVTPSHEGGVWIAGGRFEQDSDQAFVEKFDSNGGVIFDTHL